MSSNVVIPVRFKNGHPLFLYGGELPALGDCIADLIVPEESIRDRTLLDKLREEKEVIIQTSGASLLIALRLKNVPQALRTLTFQLEAGKTGPPGDFAFVQLTLKENLILRLRGTKDAELRDVKCSLPMLGQQASSINHAYTLVSTKLEPNRRAHSGNVFDLVYFLDNEVWRPLRTLRDQAEAEFEKRFRMS